MRSEKFSLLTGFEIVTLQQRPDLLDAIHALNAAAWPAFTYHGAGWTCCWDRLFTEFPGFQLAVITPQNEVAAAGHTLPAAWDGTVEDLPAGWDAFLERGFSSATQADALVGLAVVVSPDHQRRGLSAEVLKAMKPLARRAGLQRLIVPVRPMLKSRYPLTPVERYIQWRDSEGRLFDPWLRSHSLLGGQILGIAAHSKVYRGTVAEWESWAGMAFPETGQYIVHGALEPVYIDREANSGLHTEPNVWLKHPV